MCISVKNSEFEDYDWADIPQKPFSGYLIHETLEFRNDTPEISCVASFARKVVGELFFAALAVAAVVECVARTVFCLLALFFVPCCCEGADFNSVVEVGAMSATFILDLFLRCFKGLLVNPLYEKLEMEDLAICELNKAEESTLFAGV